MLIARNSSHIIRIFGLSIRPLSTLSGQGLLSSNMDKYRDLSREELVARLQELETSIASSSKLPILEKSTTWEKRKSKKWANKTSKFDLSRYPCRKIALRFSYDGAPYNGLATQKVAGTTGTPLTEKGEEVITVEDVIWKALAATRLVGEEQSMADVGWSRCGRTDRGVSAGGQVIALWVRSRKKDEWPERKTLARYVTAKKTDGIDKSSENAIDQEIDDLEEETSTIHGQFSKDSTVDQDKKVAADSQSEEIAYVSVLNAVLPPTIRIQAWSPVRSHFSARFNCRYRHYKYFFTSGCTFIDAISTKGPVPRLDISLMRQAAQKFLGDHDFRNFCKVDPSKQIDNYRRRVDGISIDEVSQPWPVAAAVRQTVNEGVSYNRDLETMFVLNLRGTAFLYHQVRHMVAILFLVGARLESPSIIDDLLNVERGAVARDRLLMRRRGLVLNKEDSKTTLPDSTATTMTGNVASDNFDTVIPKIPSFLEVVSELNQEETSLIQDVMVYGGKPEYTMASDRPLMLWECGFKETDVQWRSGTYDGPLSSTLQDQSHSGGANSTDDNIIITEDVNSSTIASAAILHSNWSSLAITSELYKHFLLALPVDVSQDQAGFIPASTYFDVSSSPTLKKASVKTDGKRHHWQGSSSSSSSYSRQIIPLGDGQFRPIQEYKGLIQSKREETPQVKNEKYLQGRGKRRADRKAVVAG